MANKLYVGNLPFNTTGDDLRQIFSEFGTVEDAVVISDKFSGRSKGFGFVTMSTDEEAQAAIAGMNDKNIGDRQAKVSEARPPEKRDGGFRPSGGYRN